MAMGAQDTTHLEFKFQVCCFLFPFFILLITIYLWVGYVYANAQQLTPANLKWKKGPNNGFVVWAL